MAFCTDSKKWMWQSWLFLVLLHSESANLSPSPTANSLGSGERTSLPLKSWQYNPLLLSSSHRHSLPHAVTTNDPVAEHSVLAKTAGNASGSMKVIAWGREWRWDEESKRGLYCHDLRGREVLSPDPRELAVGDGDRLALSEWRRTRNNQLWHIHITAKPKYHIK